MTTPLATIADALIEFILSLLRDPSAAADFIADPEETLAREGLSDISVQDVRAVVPVIVERYDVAPRPAVQLAPPAPHHVAPHPVAPHPEPPSVVREIVTVANNFHIDNRSTIIDQSVNQNIWAEGDVTQIFDQEAVLALGDQSVAAGEDAGIDNSETDINAGDIAIGNTETTTEIDGSFNDESANTVVSFGAEAEDSFNDQSADVEIDAEIDDSFQSDTSMVDSTEIVESTVYAPADVEVEAPIEAEIEEQ